jgi:hypothetical protein
VTTTQQQLNNNHGYLERAVWGSAGFLHGVQRPDPQQHPFLEQYTYTPSEIHINSVSDTGDRLVRTFNFALTNGQRNSIIQWLTESYGDDDWSEDDDEDW